MSGAPAGPWHLPRRLAYVVSHARPWSSNGYAARTHAIARALTVAGHEVIVFTKPGRPWDIEGFAPGTPPNTLPNTPLLMDRHIDGVRHICLPLTPLPGARAIQRIRAMADALTEAFYAFRPAAVLAASNWETAEPARRAAGRMGAAFFYEQRGFWELGAEGPPDQTPDQTTDAIRLETEIARDARAVFTLNALMRDELVRRGVPAGRIHLVPNGTARPGPTDARITRASLGCTSAYLLGYIGSLSPYEGVGDLLELVARLRRGGAGAAPMDVDALIVGSDAPKGLLGAHGPAGAALRTQAERLSISAHVHLVPQIPEDTAASHYRLCDAMVMPRRATPVTRLVPPIKPYTAAAHGVPVFLSDLPPLAEIAAEIGGHLFAPGDIDGLAAQVRNRLGPDQPARCLPPDPNLDWSQRIAPMLAHLAPVVAAARLRNTRLFGAAKGGVPTDTARPPVSSFDLTALPAIGLRDQLDIRPEARIGPPGPLALHITPLTRANLLEVLATAPPGRFVIDWAGLRAGPGFAQGEWAGLWSIDDMRLTRLIMDAVRIAQSCGWRLQVIGPVHRSEAPLFRTVAALMEEVVPTTTAGTPLLTPESCA